MGWIFALKRPVDNLPRTPPNAQDLMAIAEAGGADAAGAARQAARLSELRDPVLARRALSLAARLEPMDPAPRLALARLHAEAGDLKAARVEAQAIVKDAVDQAACARAAFILGELARAENAPTEARAHYEHVLKIEDRLLAMNRGDPTAARWYARARGCIAGIDFAAGALDRARTGAEGALAMLRALAAQIGEPPILAADIADAELRLAAIELEEDKPASARRRLSEAVARYEALAVTEKSEPHWPEILAQAWALAAEAEFRRAAPEPARTAMDKALQLRLRLAALGPSEEMSLAATWRTRAAMLSALGDDAGAAESIQHARLIAARIREADVHNDALAQFLVNTLFEQCGYALKSGALATANDAADAARALAEPLAVNSASAVWHSHLARAWDMLGDIAVAARSPRTGDARMRAVALWRAAAGLDTCFESHLAAALVRLGDLARAGRDMTRAQHAYHEAVTLRLAHFQAAPGDTAGALGLATALERLGLTAQALGDLSSARAAWEDELALAERIFHDRQGADRLRFCAIVEAHLASLGGADAEQRRLAALTHLDALAYKGALGERETALRRSLWRS